MKKLFVSLGLLIVGSISVSAQKVVKNLEVDKIVVQTKNLSCSWDSDSLSNEQFNSLLSAPGKIVVLKHEDDFSFEQKKVFLESRPKVSHLNSNDEIVHQGLHLEIDVNYSPFDMYTSEASGDGLVDGRLDVKNSFGAKIAMVHQFKVFYLGGGAGIKSAQLFWQPVGSDNRVCNAYGIPLFVRGGVVGALSPKIYGFVNADLGVNIGLDNMCTSFNADISAGIYYGRAKIAISMSPFQPKEKSFFGKKMTNLYNFGIGLTLGLRI